MEMRYIIERSNYICFMKGKIILLMVIAVLYPMGISAHGIDHIIARMDSADCYHATVRYAVTLPQAQDDVVYTLRLTAQDNSGDTLAPADYLIDWTLPTPDGESKGFSAYFGGHHYRFRDERLQEYHMEWDSIPFMPRLNGDRRSPGVQQSAQFVQLLPQFIADEFRRMDADPLYSLTVTPDTLIGGHRRTVVDARMTVQDYVCMESTYVLDAATGMPVSIETESNPGSISEQTIIANYSYDDTSTPCPPLSEQILMERYPEVFAHYRQSNFRIENLPGTRLPGFSLPTPTGERYTHRPSDHFAAPTIIALIEAGAGFTPDLIAALRSATDMMPVDARMIFAFTDNRHDDIDAVCPTLRTGETTLMSARSLCRDCGAAALPVVIICRQDATVSDVIIGYNNDMAATVIQKTALAARPNQK